MFLPGHHPGKICLQAASAAVRKRLSSTSGFRRRTVTENKNNN